jgi:hypothetical protein
MPTSAPVEVYWVIEAPDGRRVRCASFQTTGGLEVRLIDVARDFISRIRRVADAAVARDVARGWMVQMLEDGRTGYRIVHVGRMDEL